MEHGQLVQVEVGQFAMLLSNLAGPVQHFKAAILDAWRNKVAADLCGGAGFSVWSAAGCSWLFAAP